MSHQVNLHVDRLHGFLPLDAGSSALFQEYVDPEDHPSLPTRALDFLSEALAVAQDLRLIVLTGDAGHGKTHLCVKLLEELGYSSAEAAEALTTRCDGTHDLAALPAGGSLRIVKDLSEMPIDAGAASLVAALEAKDCVTVVCANEGRLRSALARERMQLAPVARCLEEGLADGRLDVEPRVVVLNLNFQSVAAADNPIAANLLRWMVDGRRWRICGSCDARDGCPILQNQKMLSDRVSGPRRVAALEQLFRVAERIGAVITVRELLMLTAYSMTGGLRCRDVHPRSRRRDWQADYEFTQNVFGDRLTHAEQLTLRSLRQIRLIDPGRVSLREIDDALEPQGDEADGRFSPRDASLQGAAATTRVQAKTAAATTRGLYRFMRRRAFLAGTAGSPDALKALGFTFGRDFVSVVAGQTTASESRRLRDQVIAGLEAVQGLRRSGQGRHLLLVDPAFGGGSGTASIVARRIAITHVELRSQASSWKRRLQRDADLPRALDWSDRTVVIELSDGEQVHSIPVDLLGFEYLMRAGEGLDGRAFFDAEVRRIAGALAPLVRETDGDDQIEIVRDGHLEGLVIDTGDVIRKVTD